MSFDLNTFIQEQIGGVLSNYATESLGATPSVASKAASFVIPALLGKLGGLTADNNQLSNLFGLITGPELAGNVASVSPELLEKGHSLLGGLFGDKGVSALVNLLAGKTGLSTGNTNSLLAAALPMVLGSLRSHVQTNNLSVQQFASSMNEQRGFIERILGGDFLSMLGWGGAAVAGATALAGKAVGATTSAVTGAAANAAGKTAAAVNNTTNKASGGFPKWLWLVLAGILAALALKFCGGNKPAAPVAVPAASNASAAAGVASAASVAASAASTTGVTASAAVRNASAASDAGAAKAAAAKEDTVVYENGVLTVYFATGKTAVNQAAADAVSKEVVKLGKEGKKLVVSGFNDPRGDAAKNAELSKNRAKAVKDYLVSKGVAESHIELRKPVQTEGTSATLAQDRRVDVTVE